MVRRVRRGAAIYLKLYGGLMKIRITQCKDGNLWYAKHVGDVFEIFLVVTNTRWDYVLCEWMDYLTPTVITPDGTSNIVLSGDFRFITKPGVIE